MSTTGQSILKGAKQALAHAKGSNKQVIEHKVHVPDSVDVKAIRSNLNMSQQTFADTFGFSVGSVRNWEQNHRTPEGAARSLLALIAKNPAFVIDTLNT